MATILVFLLVIVISGAFESAIESNKKKKEQAAIAIKHEEEIMAKKNKEEIAKLVELEKTRGKLIKFEQYSLIKHAQTAKIGEETQYHCPVCDCPAKHEELDYCRGLRENDALINREAMCFRCREYLLEINDEDQNELREYITELKKGNHIDIKGGIFPIPHPYHYIF